MFLLFFRNGIFFLVPISMKKKCQQFHDNSNRVIAEIIEQSIWLKSKEKLFDDTKKKRNLCESKSVRWFEIYHERPKHLLWHRKKRRKIQVSREFEFVCLNTPILCQWHKWMMNYFHTPRNIDVKSIKHCQNVFFSLPFYT